MKRKFFQIAKSYGAKINTYKSFISKGMGGLQVFDIRGKINGRPFVFTDSYFHRSGDAPKVLLQFNNELLNLNSPPVQNENK